MRLSRDALYSAVQIIITDLIASETPIHSQRHVLFLDNRFRHLQPVARKIPSYSIKAHSETQHALRKHRNFSRNLIKSNRNQIITIF